MFDFWIPLWREIKNKNLWDFINTLLGVFKIKNCEILGVLISEDQSLLYSLAKDIQ